METPVVKMVYDVCGNNFLMIGDHLIEEKSICHINLEPFREAPGSVRIGLINGHSIYLDGGEAIELRKFISAELTKSK